MPLRIGMGSSGGVRARLLATLTLLGSGSYYYFPGQSPTSRWQADSILRWRFTESLAVSMEGRINRFGIEAQGILMHYF